MRCGQKEGAPSIFATLRETVLNSLHLLFGEWRKAAVPQESHESLRRILYRLGSQGRAGHRQNGAQGRLRCADASAARAGRLRDFATYDWRERVRVGDAQNLLRH